VTGNKFLTESPQFQCDLWTLLLSAAFCLIHVNWYTFWYVKKKQKRWTNCTETIGSHRTKFSWLGVQMPGIYARMILSYCTVCTIAKP
jgi:hypothetical protein